MDIVHIVELLCIERGRDMSPLWLSLWVASIALIIVIVSGLAACYWMNRCKWSGMAIIDALYLAACIATSCCWLCSSHGVYARLCLWRMA